MDTRERMKAKGGESRSRAVQFHGASFRAVGTSQAGVNKGAFLRLVYEARQYYASETARSKFGVD